MIQTQYIIDEETIIDVFSVMKDTYLLSENVVLNPERFNPTEQAKSFINILTTLKDNK